MKVDTGNIPSELKQVSDQIISLTWSIWARTTANEGGVSLLYDVFDVVGVIGKDGFLSTLIPVPPVLIAQSCVASNI